LRSAIAGNDQPPRGAFAARLLTEEGLMNLQSIVALALLLIASIPASAGGGSIAIPEPGVVELLAIGAVAGIAVAIRKRRK
jgi:hypothetical protein